MALAPNDASDPAPRLPLVCIAEDRASCEPALRILVATLSEHTPGIRAHLFCPNATDAFRAWLESYPAFELNRHALSKAWRKYDIKPTALLTLLDAGHDDLLWIDSDILVTSDLAAVVGGLADDVIAVSEEALLPGRDDSGGLRTRLWGFEVGRSLPFVANSGVVRVTSRHRAFLERWAELLERPDYQAAQDLDWSLRPPHMLGDQDVFSAVLCSREFSAFPLKILERGKHIIQFFGLHGYTVAERVEHLRDGLPPFIHSQGFRPWWPRDPATSAGQKLKALYYELSPYTMVARRYRSVLTDASWLEPPNSVARALTWAAGGSAALVGMPIAVAADVFRGLRRLAGAWPKADAKA